MSLRNINLSEADNKSKGKCEEEAHLSSPQKSKQASGISMSNSCNRLGME